MTRRYLRHGLFLAILALSPLTGARGGDPGTASFEDLLRHYRRGPESVSPPGGRHRGKCGLAEAFQVLEQWASFTPDQQFALRSAMQVPQMQKDRIIGHFHFYYDTTGANTPAMLDASFNEIPGTAEEFVDSAGAIFNHVWNTEILSMGYLPPPLQGDGTYPVAILDLGSGLYGQTVPDPTPIVNGPPSLYQTHVEIDNSFQTVYPPSRGLPALRVTAAHEFHHSLQLGSYGFWGSSDIYFYEITSTWMEDEVYNDVNDYLQYLTNDVNQSSQFSHPEIRFTKADQSIEYSRAVWGKYIGKRFSPDVMRRFWVAIEQTRTLQAIDNVLGANGSSLQQAFQEFAYWNLNTGPQCDTSRFYTEGNTYPQIRLDTATYFPPVVSVSGQLQSFSSAYTRFCVHLTASDTTPCVYGTNAMTTIVNNVNFSTGYSDQLYPYTYSLAQSPTTAARQLSNGLYAYLSVADPANWGVQETVPSVVQDITVFPNPYRTDASHALWFRFPSTPTSSTVQLVIYSSSFQQVFSGDLPVLYYRPLEPALRWDGILNDGRRIRTGVYFYYLNVDNAQHTGKFAVILQ